MYSVVIVDDEKLICDAIRSVLEASVPEISQIRIFNDGDDAYEYLKTNRADILLLDIEVPGRTGLDIAQLVREQQADCYIMIITAYHDFEYARQAIRCSVNEFMTKPFSSKQLITGVRKAISFFEESTARREDNRKTYRSLLLTLCRTSTTPKGYGDICFCRKSTPLKELTCTEVTVTDGGFDTVPAQLYSTLEEKMICASEFDSYEQTSLLIERTPELIRILVLSKSAPDLSFLTNLASVIQAQTGSQPVCTHRIYASFARYRAWVSFEREMEFFIDLLVGTSASHAKKHLIKYIQTLTQPQLNTFAEFLTCNYDVQTDGETDHIVQSLDQIIQGYLRNDSSNHIVESAKRYMQQNFSSSALSLKSVAEALYVSSAYLSRLFKKHAGCNFSEYLLKLRMDHARQLLQSTNLPTTAISTSVGYENQAYFRMSFKSYFGMTPSQYRQVQNNGKDVGEL